MFRSQTNSLSFLLPDSPTKDNGGGKQPCLYLHAGCRLLGEGLAPSRRCHFPGPVSDAQSQQGNPWGEAAWRRDGAGAGMPALHPPRTPAPLLLPALCAPQA